MKRAAHTGYYLPIVEIKDCNVKIDGRNFFDQSINDNIKKCEKKKIKKMLLFKEMIKQLVLY